MVADADVIIVGTGLAELVAAYELAEADKRVTLVDQEPDQSIGGQAFWSYGGLFLVDSPQQRRMGLRDSCELALLDWMGTAGFDRPEDEWPRRWAEAYVAFAGGEKRCWLHDQGVRVFPIVGWAEHGGRGADGPGNSVPRFHIAWGTGPGLLAPSRAGCARRRSAASSRSSSAIASMPSASPAAWWKACRATFSNRAMWCAAGPARARSWATVA